MDNPSGSFKSDEIREIKAEELEFLSKYTKEENLELLRQHVLDVYNETKDKFHVFNCIQTFMFLQPRITKHPALQKVLSLLGENGVICDVGCCFAQDIRALLLEGVKHHQLMACDLERNYFDQGMKLFKDFDEMEKIKVCFGDISKPETHASMIKSLNGQPLRAISCFAVFHTMSREQVASFLEASFKLLDDKGILFGWCLGSDSETGPRVWKTKNNDEVSTLTEGCRYLHSCESLKKEMECVGFQEVEVAGKKENHSVRVNTKLMDGKEFLYFTAQKNT